VLVDYLLSCASSEEGRKMKGESFLKAAAIREFVVEKFFCGDDEIVKEDTSFLEEGHTYPWSIVELAMFLEKTYDITIEDDELVPKNLDSLQNIARLIDQKVN
jgi:acyl carrier protein